jgi:hypothetical protein
MKLFILIIAALAGFAMAQNLDDLPPCGVSIFHDY